MMDLVARKKHHEDRPRWTGETIDRTAPNRMPNTNYFRSKGDQKKVVNLAQKKGTNFARKKKRRQKEVSLLSLSDSTACSFQIMPRYKIKKLGCERGQHARKEVEFAMNLTCRGRTKDTRIAKLDHRRKLPLQKKVSISLGCCFLF